VKTRLYVLQHGHALSKEEDPERPLSAAGMHDIERLANHLAEKDVLIWKIFHSGKLRAEQTAQIIANRVSPEVIPQLCEGVAPGDDPASFIKSLDISHGSILLVSHMPFLTKLCSVLLSGNESSQFEFAPGTIACMGCVDGQWSMLCMLRPEVL